jgi:transcriptional regulator with XRE-family HTH domain
MDLKSHIGIRVRSARRRAGLTQEQLAEEVDKAVETISNIERGHSQAGLETLEELSKALKTPLIYFFEGYRPGLRISRRRAEAQQQLLDIFAKLPDEQIGVAVKLIEVLQGHGGS